MRLSFQKRDGGIWSHDRLTGAKWFKRRNGRTGQSMIESCMVVALISLLLFGMLQLSHVFMAQEVLDFAAFSGARARAVGFNDFMVQKAVRVACIPIAGRLVTPTLDSTADPIWQNKDLGWLWINAVAHSHGSTQSQFSVESARIPLYLGGSGWGTLPAILDYERWSTVDTPSLLENVATIKAQTGQNTPLLFPFHRAFFAADEIRMEGQATVESHYPLYLQ